MIANIMNPLGELPLIIALSFSVYLSFEYWRFPDLTVETVFVSGMVAGYIGSALGNSFMAELLLMLVVSAVFVLFYSSITLALFKARLPPLFAGLIVLLAGYSINFLLNGQQLTQTLNPHDSSIILYFKNLAWDGTLKILWVIGLTLVLLSAAFLLWLDQTKLGAKIRLLRQLDSKELIATVTDKPAAYLLLGMIAYNFVAVIGGMSFGLSNSLASVETFGYVTVGLATMFLVRALRQALASPTRRSTSDKNRERSDGFLRKTDNLSWIMLILLVSSFLICLGRYFATTMIVNQPGIVNALTAASIVAVWSGVFLIAWLLGRALPEA
jgi:ABC-type uncharacterized transport system permease subunit